MSVRDASSVGPDTDKVDTREQMIGREECSTRREDIHPSRVNVRNRVPIGPRSRLPLRPLSGAAAAGKGREREAGREWEASAPWHVGVKLARVKRENAECNGGAVCIPCPKHCRLGGIGIGDGWPDIHGDIQLLLP